MAENKVIDKLTPEQEKAMERYADEWIQIGLCTDRANRENAEYWLKECYKVAGLEPPEIFEWFGSPKAARDRAKNLLSGSENYCCYGQHEADWLALYTFYYHELGIDQAKDILPMAEVAKECGWWWPYNDRVLVSERPTEIHRNEEGRLHNENGPAIAYEDGFQLFFVHGVRVTEDIVYRRYSAQDIADESNQELRRIMLDLYGEEKFLVDLGAKPVDKNERNEELYRVEMSGDEALVMVRVINSSPEPDGSYRHYYLRVPPHVQTASEAVAWTFALEAGQYTPAIET